MKVINEMHSWKTEWNYFTGTIGNNGTRWLWRRYSYFISQESNIYLLCITAAGKKNNGMRFELQTSVNKIRLVHNQNVAAAAAAAAAEAAASVA